MNELGFAFRPLTRDDFPLVGLWLREPHVARWWADDPTPKGLEADYGGVIDGTEPAEVFIAYHAGRPIGLAQRFRMDAYPDYRDEVDAVVPVPPAAAGIDFLIGDSTRIGQGLGTRMLKEFATQLWRDDPAASGIIVPVHVENSASWRALEKAGFTRIGDGHMSPDNPADTTHHFVYWRPSE